MRIVDSTISRLVQKRSLKIDRRFFNPLAVQHGARNRGTRSVPLRLRRHREDCKGGTVFVLGEVTEGRSSFLKPLVKKNGTSYRTQDKTANIDAPIEMKPQSSIAESRKREEPACSQKHLAPTISRATSYQDTRMFYPDADNVDAEDARQSSRLKIRELFALSLLGVGAII